MPSLCCEGCVPAHPVGMDLLCALHCRETVRRFQWILEAQRVRSKVEEAAPSVLLPLGEWNRDSKDSTGSFPNSALHPGCP